MLLAVGLTHLNGEKYVAHILYHCKIVQRCIFRDHKVRKHYAMLVVCDGPSNNVGQKTLIMAVAEIARLRVDSNPRRYDDTLTCGAPTSTNRSLFFLSETVSQKFAVLLESALTSTRDVVGYEEGTLTKDHNIYLEERYGRNLSISSASATKRAMRRWIADVLVKDTVATDLPAQDVDKELGIGPSSRGVVICAIDCKLSSCWRHVQRRYN